MGRRHRGDAVRNRIRTDGDAADGSRVTRDVLERDVGHEDDPVGVARRLLRIEEVRRLLARLQREVAVLDRMLEEVGDQQALG